MYDLRDIRHIAHKMRLLAVAEWMHHMEEYRGFLDRDHSVADEAHKVIFMAPRKYNASCIE